MPSLSSSPSNSPSPSTSPSTLPSTSPSLSSSPQPSRQEALRHQAIEAFPGSFWGSESAAWLIVSAQPLDDVTQHALRASAHALGTNPNDLAFLVVGESTVMPVNATIAEIASGSVNNEDSLPVAAEHLIALIEALDPLAVVLTDHTSVALASRAYHTPLALETHEYLLGRPCCCFEDLASLMERPEDKQRAWNCLKTLRI